MKEATSRGIVMKLICCMALAVLTSAVAFSQTPKSGALLTIDGTGASSGVHLKIYDSQIHTGTVRTPAGNGSCSPLAGSDDIPTDAYVLQGGSATGCDPGDAFETLQGASPGGSATIAGTGYSFGIATIYTIGPMCNTNNTICVGGNSGNPDTGFLTVTNNSGAGLDFSGTITLAGTSPIAGGLYCPPLVGSVGVASDSSGPSTLANGASWVFALSKDSSNCGGFNAPQILTLTAGQLSTAKFGKDDYQIMPLNSAAGDTLSVLPVPVPAGPLGLDTWGTGKFGSETPVFSSLRFSAGTNFAPTTYACVPYADFSANVANGNPVCVELQIGCTNTITANACSDAFLYTVQNDFNIDANSLQGGVGGPAFLGHHLVDCPDTAFDLNIFTSYTAPSATFGDPLKGGGSGTPSCWVTAFDPNATAVTTGNIVSSFTGFTGLLASPSLNRVNIGSAFPLNFTFPTAGLHLCSTVNNSGSSCTGGASRPWVAFGTISIDCTTKVVAPTQTEVSAAAGGSNLQTISTTPSLTSYRFNWKTSKTSTTPPPPTPGSCVVMVAQFSTGLTVFPDYFQFK